VQAALRGPGDRDRLGWLASLSIGERGADPRAFAGTPPRLPLGAGSWQGSVTRSV
jgi:hypothetical protein